MRKTWIAVLVVAAAALGGSAAMLGSALAGGPELKLEKATAWSYVGVSAGTANLGPHSKHVTGAAWVGTGVVDVSFTTDIGNCASLATPISGPTFVAVRHESLNSVRIFTHNLAGAAVNASFNVILECKP